MKIVPGINVQHPWTELILSGRKTIETRFYPLPAKYIGVPIAIIETPGRSKHIKSRVIGIVVFSGCYAYNSKKEFNKDFDKHHVKEGHAFAWKKDKTKWAWTIKSVTRLKSPQPAPPKRGIIWTVEVSI